MNEAKFIDVVGVRTRYFVAGEGAPLVLFHGGNFGSQNLAESACDWELNVQGLSRWYRVFAVDKLGQGYTDNPKDDDYSMAAVVRHAQGFLAALGLENVHVVGHSRGGYLVCRLTLDHPERIRSCVVVDSNTLAPGVPRSEIVLANPPEPRLSRESQRWIIERYSFATGHITESWLDEVCAVAALPKSREALEKMEAGGLRSSYFMPGLARDKEDTFARLRDQGTRRPTQVMWGYNDPTATLAQGQALFDVIASTERRARMVVLNEAGHFSFREQVDSFNHALRGFIDGLGPVGGSY